MIETLQAPAVPAPTPFRRELELITITARRALLVRYRGTALGVLWSFGNPLLMTLLYTALFGTAFRSYYGSLGRYMLAAFVGVLIVTFFLQATGEALVSIVANGVLLGKIAVRPIIFPLATIASNGFQQAVTAVPVLLILTIVFAHDPLRLALLPVVLLALLALSTGVSLILATLYVFFRDLPHLWAIVGFILWISSPVFYPVALLPANIRPWIDFNPVAVSIGALRDVVAGTGPLNVGSIAIAVVSSAIVLVVGVVILVANERKFADLL